MTIGDIIHDVRRLVNDTTIEYRWPDSDIADFLRDAIDRLRVVRPIARLGDDGRIDEREFPDDVLSYELSGNCSRWRQGLVYYAASRCLEMDAADTVNQSLAVDFMSKAEARFAT